MPYFSLDSIKEALSLFLDLLVCLFNFREVLREYSLDLLGLFALLVGDEPNSESIGDIKPDGIGLMSKLSKSLGPSFAFFAAISASLAFLNYNSTSSSFSYFYLRINSPWQIKFSNSVGAISYA